MLMVVMISAEVEDSHLVHAMNYCVPLKMLLLDVKVQNCHDLALAVVLDEGWMMVWM